ncbi:MAG: N-acetylmannosamine-6-phosphate 2-epimerase, partial [Vulcanimicrobiaceae bacterium]
VSVQPEASSVLSPPNVVAELAACAIDNGAIAVRIESAERIAAVRARCGDAPIVGLIKHTVPGFEPYITARLSDVERVLDAGAGIVAFDATSRPRPDGSTLAAVIALVHRRGAIAFADCAELEDARGSLAAGADIVSTTLCGYTRETKGAKLPALDLVVAIKALGAPFTVCEGGIGNPSEAAAAFGAGADAIVVGTAITNIDLLVRRFAEAVNDS